MKTLILAAALTVATSAVAAPDAPVETAPATQTAPDGATQSQIQGFLKPGAYLGLARVESAQKQFEGARQTLDALDKMGTVLPLYDAQIAKLRAMLP